MSISSCKVQICVKGIVLTSDGEEGKGLVLGEDCGGDAKWWRVSYWWETVKWWLQHPPTVEKSCIAFCRRTRYIAVGRLTRAAAANHEVRRVLCGEDSGDSGGRWVGESMDMVGRGYGETVLGDSVVTVLGDVVVGGLFRAERPHHGSQQKVRKKFTIEKKHLVGEKKNIWWGKKKTRLTRSDASFYEVCTCFSNSRSQYATAK